MRHHIALAAAIALAVLLLASPLAAEIPERTVELSFTAGAGLSNNYFSLADLFPEDGVLLIDLDDMAEAIGPSGFRLAGDAPIGISLDVKLPKSLKVGLFTGVSAYALGCLPDSLFDLLANGNGEGETISGDLDFKGDVFVEIGARASLGWEKWEFSLAPAFFGSALHIAEPTASYSVSTDPVAGTMTAVGTAVIPVYSAVPFDAFGEIGGGEILGAVLASGGLDLSLGATYRLLPDLVLGASLKRVPIVPARPGYLNTVTATFEATAEDLIGGEESIAMDESHEVETAEGSAKVFRPFKGGVSAVWTPEAVGFLTVFGNLDLAIYRGVYADVGAGAMATLANALSGSYEIAFEDLVWKHRLGFIVNLRYFELNGKISLQSPDFLDSFAARGLSAVIGIKLGY